MFGAFLSFFYVKWDLSGGLVLGLLRVLVCLFFM